MEAIDGVAVIEAPSRAHWRAWLEDNCTSLRSVWVRIFGQRSSTPSVRFHDAIEDALCFGWVDSKAIKRDPESCYLLFSPRNPTSSWGRINRQRADKMIKQGLMRPHGAGGHRPGQTDRHVGCPGRGAEPGGATRSAGAVRRRRSCRSELFRLPPSSRRLILEWIMKAKRPETRERRIRQTVDQARVDVRANH
jgi:uncharacterized protein YdeI (YjbR/CyaY-like superfamily)